MNNFEHNQVVAIEELSEITIELSLLQDYLFLAQDGSFSTEDIFDSERLNSEVCDFIGSMELIHEQLTPVVKERISLFLGSDFLDSGFICPLDLVDSSQEYEGISDDDRLDLAIRFIREAIIDVSRLQQRMSKSLRFGILDGYSKEDGTNAKHIRELSVSLLNKINKVSQVIPATSNIPMIKLGFFDSEKSEKKKAKVEKWKLQAEKNGTLILTDNYCKSLGRDISEISHDPN